MNGLSRINRRHKSKVLFVLIFSLSLFLNTSSAQAWPWSGSAANPAGIAEAEASSSNNYDEIEKLGDLLGKGLLTQKEFDAKKKQILGL